MASENPIRFTLSDETNVIIKMVADNKYDFELVLPNGNHKTFLWSLGNDIGFEDRNGNLDPLVQEAVKRFILMINS
ncbi:MAG: hypothetical protein ABJA35_11245 [Parafilimonas sp.]